MFNLESQTDICIAVYDIYALNLSQFYQDECSVSVTETGIICVAISGTQCMLTIVNLTYPVVFHVYNACFKLFSLLWNN